MEDDFLRTVFDVVHGGNPSHLIFGFEGLRDWKKVYAKWPSYWDDPRSELKDYPSFFFSYSYSDYDTVDKILAAIAGTQKMLYLYGYNADAEEEKKRPAVSHIQPLEGQISMLSAS